MKTQTSRYKVKSLALSGSAAAAAALAAPANAQYSYYVQTPINTTVSTTGTGGSATTGINLNRVQSLGPASAAHLTNVTVDLFSGQFYTQSWNDGNVLNNAVLTTTFQGYSYLSGLDGLNVHVSTGPDVQQVNTYCPSAFGIGGCSGTFTYQSSSSGAQGLGAQSNFVGAGSIAVTLGVKDQSITSQECYCSIFCAVTNCPGSFQGFYDTSLTGGIAQIQYSFSGVPAPGALAVYFPALATALGVMRRRRNFRCR